MTGKTRETGSHRPGSHGRQGSQRILGRCTTSLIVTYFLYDSVDKGVRRDEGDRGDKRVRGDGRQSTYIMLSQHIS